MLRRRLDDLGGGGTMDEAVAAIGLRSGEYAGSFGRFPEWGRANLVDDHHEAARGSGPYWFGPGVPRRNPSSTMAQIDTARDASPKMTADPVVLPAPSSSAGTR